MEPPTAKELTVTPNNFKKGSPTNKKPIINSPEITVALNSLMPPIFAFSEISNGMEPIASITAKSVKLTVRKCCKLKPMVPFFCKSKSPVAKGT
jgi:hypothetical protein